jgi:hypothetical protein
VTYKLSPKDKRKQVRQRGKGEREENRKHRTLGGHRERAKENQREHRDRGNKNDYI